MARDVMAEWMRALARGGVAQRAAWARVSEGQRSRLMSSTPLPAPGGERAAASALRATRPLRVNGQAAARGDIEAALRVLRRNNALLRRRFGIGWPMAAGVVIGEAARRGTTAASLARLLAAGLRRDAREGGAR